MAEKKSLFAPKRDICAFCSGTGCENQRVNFGNNWREDYRMWTEKAFDAINEKVEKVQEELF